MMWRSSRCVVQLSGSGRESGLVQLWTARPLLSKLIGGDRGISSAGACLAGHADGIARGHRLCRFLIGKENRSSSRTDRGRR